MGLEVKQKKRENAVFKIMITYKTNFEKNIILRYND